MMMLAAADNSAGAYEIFFAYDNIVGTFVDGTIGVENVDGTLATKLVYNDVNSVISDDLLICLDWAASAADSAWRWPSNSS